MKKDRSGALLTLAMLVVSASFIAETSYMFWSDRQLQRESRGLQVNALPSVDQLSVARRHISEMTRCTALRTDAATASRCIAGARRRFVDAFDAYRVLPLYPGEEQLHPKVDHALAGFDGHVAPLAVGQQLTPAAVADANDDLLDLDDAVRQLVVINAQQAFGHTARIDNLRARSELFEIVLGAVALAIAATATLLGVRATRRHARFLEERARELDLFAATVAHDLVGPLTSVGMAMPMIKQRHPDDNTTQKLAERALSSVRRVRTLVDGLLAFARAGAEPTHGPADLVEAIDSVTHELGEYAEVQHVELVVGTIDRAQLSCAPAVLASILANLVRNAIKHMGDSDPRRVEVRATTRDDRVLVEVEDTGPGVPTQARDMIFQPHVRLDPGQKPGLGLGLATVKRLVIAHGGSVGVRPAHPRGAVFWFELPRVGPTAAVARSA